MAGYDDNRRGYGWDGSSDDPWDGAPYDAPYDDPYGAGAGSTYDDGYDDGYGYGSRYSHDGGRGADEGRGAPPVRRTRHSHRPPTDMLHADTAHEPISRHAFIMCGFGLLTVAAAVRLADYQIINRDTYVYEANTRRLLSQTLYAKRGTIYDRNGNVLTSSIECENVYLNPQLIEEGTEDEVVAALVEVLGIEEETAEYYVGLDTTFVYVQRQVDQDEADELAAYGLAGIEFEQAMKRVYPYGNLASQLLGVVNIDNEGASGLEQYYDDILTGTNGSLVRERSSDGTYIAGGAYEKVAAVDGTDLVLTIDATIQEAAEEACATWTENAGADRGSIFVTDPTTGEIYAACSYPTYDQTDLANTTYEDMVLRGVVDAYEPGSVFKTFVCGAAINEGLVTPDSTFSVPAEIEVGDDTVTDIDGRDYTMTMTVREILRRSSNVGMVLVGRTLGSELFAQYVDAYGFGSSCGIDYPGESAGIVKSLDEYDGATLGSMSFGQSLAVPPCQMIRAMSGIANGGVMTTPHFVMSQGGEELDWTAGETEVIGADAAAQVADMMLTVVDEGTGTSAQIEGYEVSGKTGTAEQAAEGSTGYTEGNNMASFMGFVSTTDPRVLCYVTLDGTSYQSTMAQPAFVEVMETALPVLGISGTR